MEDTARFGGGVAVAVILQASHAIAAQQVAAVPTADKACQQVMTLAPVATMLHAGSHFGFQLRRDDFWNGWHGNSQSLDAQIGNVKFLDVDA